MLVMPPLSHSVVQKANIKAPTLVAGSRARLGTDKATGMHLPRAFPTFHLLPSSCA